MENINEEYFNNMLDSLFEDDKDLQMSLIKQYMYDEDKDIYITPNNELDEEEEIECLKKLHTNRNGFDVYMYVVKVDRSHLPSKQEFLIEEKLTQLEKEVADLKKWI